MRKFYIVAIAIEPECLPYQTVGVAGVPAQRAGVTALFFGRIALSLPPGHHPTRGRSASESHQRKRVVTPVIVCTIAASADQAHSHKPCAGGNCSHVVGFLPHSSLRSVSGIKDRQDIRSRGVTVF